MNEEAQTELKKLLISRFSTSISTRTNYARGEDTYDPILSKAVVFPETNEEVSKILKLCNEHKIPVVPFGTGTSLEGNRKRGTLLNDYSIGQGNKWSF